MGAVAASEAMAARSEGGVRADELRAALDRTLGLAAVDERVAPLVAATKLRLRLEVTDLGLVLNVAGDEDGGGLRWWFGDDPGFRPRLSLAMDAEMANRYLLGAESLAIAIAHGRVRVSGEPRGVLLDLPAARLVCEPYREVVQSRFPSLAGRVEEPD